MKKKQNQVLPHELLQKALERQKRQTPSYSMRALARKVNVSSSFMGAVLQGKKKIPLERIKEIARALRMDIPAQKILKKAVLLDALKENKELLSLVKEQLRERKFASKSALAEHKEKTLGEFSVLEDWYYIPLLDLVTCSNFKPEPLWISRRLSITAVEAERAFTRLQASGMIAMQSGKWRKIEEKIRFPTTRSHSGVRQYHKAMIQKALYALLQETDDPAFDKRLITSISFAANPQMLTRAKEHLLEALYQIADLMAEGKEHTEVYQLNAQLIPLTRKI